MLSRAFSTRTRRRGRTGNERIKDNETVVLSFWLLAKMTQVFFQNFFVGFDTYTDVSNQTKSYQFFTDLRETTYENRNIGFTLPVIVRKGKHNNAHSVVQLG